METLACFHCLEPGHWAEECKLRVKAENRKEHFGRIEMFIRWYVEGRVPGNDDSRITDHDKRRLIAAENKLWYDGELPPSLKALSH